MIYFTADEHYNHNNIIVYARRPFCSIIEMNKEIIKRHNEIVTCKDTVIHIGDFCYGDIRSAYYIIKKLNGMHQFLKGDHDRWMKGRSGWFDKAGIDSNNNARKYIEEARNKKELLRILKVGNRIHEQITLCHWCMRTWKKSHYNSIMLYGHSHGRLKPIGKQWDVGVDNNNYYPISLERILEMMKTFPDNPNYVGRDGNTVEQSVVNGV